MLGHMVVRTLSPAFTVIGTVRGEAACAGGSADGYRMLGHVDASQPTSVARALETARPEVVVNCIGAVKQVAAGQDHVLAVRLNALFPHELRDLCGRHGARLIHISTDCVFSGRRGNYRETDEADPLDLYGRSKLLGEIVAADCLTLRCSLIGRELRERHGLVEWFLGQRGGSIRGYSGAVFSGVTTQEMARVIALLCQPTSSLSGLWHVAAAPIDKYSLLQRLNEAFGTCTRIERDTAFVCDRSLDGSAFSQRTGYRAPGWDAMIEELALTRGG